MNGLSEQHRWFVALWWVCALIYVIFAVRTGVRGDYGLMGGQLLMAVFYVVAAAVFGRLNRRPS